jgi:phage host-nuclease inhibitor protein Gam
MNDLANICNHERRLVSQRDAEVLAINKLYEGNLAVYATTKKEKTDALRAYAEANPGSFPKGRKSITLTSGTIGFRTGTPKLALLSRAFNWDSVLQILRNLGNAAWIRTKEEVNKEQILADHSAGISSDTLKRYGLKVTQEETFFAEPDLTLFETRQTIETK